MATPRSVAEQVGLDDPDAQPFQPPALEQAQEEPERPDWLLPQFKTEADQARAYSESQREMSRAQASEQNTQRALAELAQEMDELRQQAQQYQQQQPPAVDPYLAMLSEKADMAFENGDMQAWHEAQDARMVYMMQGMWQMMNQQQQPRADVSDDVLDNLAAGFVEQQVARSLGDEYTEEFRREFGDYLQPRRHTIRDYRTDPTGTVQDILEQATNFKNAKALAANGERAVSQQQQAAHAKRLAQTAPGSSGRPPGAKSPEDALMERWGQMQRPYWAGG